MMFWQSVLGGIGVLAHWEVWGALLLYAGLQLAWLVGIGMLIANAESGGRIAAGCLTHMIGGTLLRTFLLGMLVLVLTPIMLGGHEALPLRLVPVFAWPVVKASLLALVVSLGMSFTPVVGNLIAKMPGLDTFIQGIIIFRLFSGTFIEYLLARAGLNVPDLYPGFWACVGYFLISAVLVPTCGFLLAEFRTAIVRSQYRGDGGLPLIVTTVLVEILGLLPLFMYAAYVSLAIRRVAGG